MGFKPNKIVTWNISQICPQYIHPCLLGLLFQGLEKLITSDQLCTNIRNDLSSGWEKEGFLLIPNLV